MRILKTAVCLFVLIVELRAGAQQGLQRQTISRADTINRIESPIVSVEAFRTPLRIPVVPYAVSVVLHPIDQPGLSFSEVLQAVPGVQVDNRFNYAVGDRISIRGFGARTQFGVRGVRIVADGVPATFADGQSALEIIDPEDVHYTEVLRGPQSSLYGNAAGGVIMMHPEILGTNPYALRLGVTAGQDGLLSYRAKFATDLTDIATFNAAVSNFGYTGFRDYDTSHILRGSLGSNISITSTESLKLGFQFAKFDALNPGSLTQRQLDSNRTQANQNNIRQHASKEGDQEQFSAKFISDGAKTDIHAMGYAIMRNVENPIATKITDLKRSAMGLEASVHHTLEVGPMPILGILGASLESQFDDRQSYTNDQGVRRVFESDQDERVFNTAAFLQLTAPLAEQILAIGSARLDNIRFSTTARFIDSSLPKGTGERTMSAFSPSFGLSWFPSKAVTLFANVHSAFETPTTTELGNSEFGLGGFSNDLNPQRSLGFEVGLRGGFTNVKVRAGEWLRYELTGYNTKVTDELIPFEIPSAPGQNYFRNAGSAVHQGLEAAVSVQPIDELLLAASFSLTDAKFEEYTVKGVSYSGKEIPGIAPQKLTVRIEVLPIEDLSLSFTARSQSRMMANDSNTVNSPGFVVADAALRLNDLLHLFGSERTASRLQITVGATNLFDTEYNTAVTANAALARYFEPGPGRTIYAKLGYALH